MRRTTVFLSLIWCAVAYQEAHAQGFWYAPPGADFSYRYGIDVGNGLGFGYSFGYGYGNAATPEIAVANAAADLARFQGQSYWMQSQLLNDDSGFGHDDSWNQWSLPPVKKVKSVQAKSKNKALVVAQPVAIAKPIVAVPLNDVELDRRTGQIDWPVALRRDKFSTQRVEVESLLKAAAQQGVTAELSTGISVKVRELRSDLREQIRRMPTNDYLDAKTFLKRLEVESRPAAV